MGTDDAQRGGMDGARRNPSNSREETMGFARALPMLPRFTRLRFPDAVQREAVHR
jgi:hypothetical protein